jgi:2-acylglycerol O-acyltransferase 2
MKGLIEDCVLFTLFTLIILSPFIILFAFIILSYFWSLPMTLLIGFSYSSWMYFDRYTAVRGGRVSNYLRQLSIWTIVSHYFPVTLVKTEDLEPNRNYIFGYHPHGRLTVGGINFLTEATHFSALFPGMRPHLMTLHSNFFMPFFRELLLNLGNDNV